MRRRPALDVPAAVPISRRGVVRSRPTGDQTLYLIDWDDPIGGPEFGFYSGSGLLAIGSPVLGTWHQTLNTWVIESIGSDPTIVGGVKKGTFTLNTATGSQSITDVGFQPQALIIWGSNQTAHGGPSDTVQYSIGMTNGTEQYVQASAQDDNSNAVAYTTFRDNAIISLHNGSGTEDLRADLTSLDAGGFTINISNASSAYIYHYIAIGGQQLTRVAGGTFAGNGATGSQSVTDVGFQADALIVMGSPITGTFPKSSTGGAHGYVGFATATGGVQSGSTAWKKADGSSSGGFDTAADEGTGVLIRLYDFSSNGSVQTSGSFTSFDTNGFTLSWTDANTFDYAYLAFEGGSWFTGSFTDAAASGDQAVTGVGFAPAGVFMLGKGDGAPASDVSISVAGYDGTAQGVVTLVHEDDGFNGTSNEAHVWNEIDNVSLYLTGVGTNPPTETAQASAVSLDGDGFTVNWSASAAGLMAHRYIALDVGAATAITETVAHDDLTGVTADQHHAESHTVASHSDTTATGTELETLTNGSNADALHSHSAVTGHASAHITGGGDEIDGDKIDIDWTPTNYTPSTTPAEADSLDNLTAHLYGIDQQLGGGGGGDHGGLTGLGDDDHPQYALLAGRATGQTLIGGTASGEDLTLQSTANATKGSIFVGSSSLFEFDETAGQLKIPTTGSGAGIVIGADVHLYRGTTNTLDLAAGDILRVNGTTSGSAALTPGANTAYLNVEAVTNNWAFRTLVIGDSNERLVIRSHGPIEWGSGSAATDIVMQRGGANRLDLGTGDSFQINGATSGFLRVTSAANSGYVYSSGTSGQWSMITRVTGDADNRFQIEVQGLLEWGNGTNAPDVSLSRGATNRLDLGSGDSLRVPAQLDVEGYAAFGNGSALSDSQTMIIDRDFSGGSVNNLRQLLVQGVITSGSGTGNIFHSEFMPAGAAGITINDGNNHTYVSGVTIHEPNITLTAGSTVSAASTLHISGGPTEGTNNYALLVDAGLARFDGDGTHVFWLPTDATDPTSGGGAATGRIPVTIGGATRYLAYY